MSKRTRKSRHIASSEEEVSDTEVQSNPDLDNSNTDEEMEECPIRQRVASQPDTKKSSGQRPTPAVATKRPSPGHPSKWPSHGQASKTSAGAAEHVQGSTSSARWDEDFRIDNETLIHLVEDRPALWDLHDRQYADRHHQRAMLFEVCRNLCKTWDTLSKSDKRECKAKISTRWRSIRDRFIRDYN